MVAAEIVEAEVTDHTALTNIGTNTHAQVDTHLASTSNPHSTSDANLTTSDVTTNDVSITKHGFAPKAPNDATKFLRGDATWDVPAGGIGYCLYFQATSTNPLDSTTYLIGVVPHIWTTTADVKIVRIPKAGTIKTAYVNMYATGVAGSNDQIDVYVRLNGTTDTLIASVSAATALREFSNTALSIAVVQGDYFEIKIVTPAWVTNPTAVTIGGHVYIE